MSVVHYNLVRRLHFISTTSCAVGANGSPLDVVGQTIATITLGSFIVDHNFIVVWNLTVDCLLGANFMKYHAGILDCDHNTFRLGRESKVTIPITLKHQPVLSNASCGANLVHSLCDLEIPARSMRLILGTVDTPNAANSVMLIEPVETLPNQLHIACSLSSYCNNTITVQVLNVSPSPITVFKGMSLGKVTPKCDVLLVCDDHMQAAVQVPSFDDLHLPELSESEKFPLLDLLSEFSDILHLLQAPAAAPQQLSMLFLPLGHQFANPCAAFRKL